MEKQETFVKECTLERLKGHTAAVTALAFAPSVDNPESFYTHAIQSEGVFASGSEDGTIRVWDLRVNKYIVLSHEV